MKFEETRRLELSPTTRRIVQDGTAVDTIVACIDQDTPLSDFATLVVETFREQWHSGALEDADRPFLAYRNPNSELWRSIMPRELDRRSRRR